MSRKHWSAEHHEVRQWFGDGQSVSAARKAGVTFAIVVPILLAVGAVGLVVSAGSKTSGRQLTAAATASRADAATAPVDGAGNAVSLTQTATQAMASGNCTLVVPANPLSAQGLATPYQLGDGCTESNAGQQAFAEATILSPNGQLQVYNPLVTTQGVQPAARPVRPQIPAGSRVVIDVGFNGTNLVLTGAGATQGHCVDALGQSLIGQVAACNATSFFQLANAEIAQGTLKIRALGKANDGQLCLDTRNYGMIDQDQSDNVNTTYLLNAANGQTAQTTAANARAMPGATTIANDRHDIRNNARAGRNIARAGRNNAANTVPGQANVTNTVPGQANVTNTVPGQANVTNTVPGQANVTNTVPGQANVTNTVPGQATRPTTVPGQANVTNTVPGQANAATALPGQGNAANPQAVAGTPIVNGSDNALLTKFLDKALGCTPFTARSVTTAGGTAASQTLDELSARANQQDPVALVPPNDEMVLVNGQFSIAKTNVYRSLVGQAPVAAGANATQLAATYCQNMVNIQPRRSQLDMTRETGVGSPVAAVGNNLATFMGNRLSMSFTNLNCQNFGLTNPVTVTLDPTGFATAVAYNATQQAANLNATTACATPTAGAAPTTADAIPTACPTSATDPAAAGAAAADLPAAGAAACATPTVGAAPTTADAIPTACPTPGAGPPAAGAAAADLPAAGATAADPPAAGATACATPTAGAAPTTADAISTACPTPAADPQVAGATAADAPVAGAPAAGATPAAITPAPPAPPGG